MIYMFLNICAVSLFPVNPFTHGRFPVSDEDTLQNSSRVLYRR